MKDGVCPKCSATTIMPNVYIPTHGHYNAVQGLAIEIDNNPNAILLHAPQRYLLRAWVCGTCGYMELYVDDPRRLYKAYQEAQRRQQ